MTTPMRKDADVYASDVYCDLSSGRSVLLQDPALYSSKIKPRHVLSAVKKYVAIHELWRLLDANKKVVCVRNISACRTTEEELLALTHRVIIIEKSEGVQVQCLAPIDESGLFIQYSTKRDRTSMSTFYRGVADYNGFAVVSFTYNINKMETVVTFNAVYLDFYSLEIRKHSESINILSESKFKFNIMVQCGILCILWPFHHCFSVLDFTNPSSKFVNHTIDEALDGFYVAALSGEYLHITMNNLDFEDDVFFESHASKRHTAYYSLKSGKRYSSENSMMKMSKIMKIQHPVDVVFINMPNKPMWMVTECLPSQMSLSKIMFFTEVELESDVCIKKRLELDVLFAEHVSLFDEPNEHQINFEICKLRWHIFLWISKRHILEVDLNTLQVVAILKMVASQYDDYRNEINDFTMKMSLDRRCLNVFVKDRKSIIHFETFHLHRPLLLKELAKFKVIDIYPKSTVEELLLHPTVKAELLISY